MNIDDENTTENDFNYEQYINEFIPKDFVSLDILDSFLIRNNQLKVKANQTFSEIERRIQEKKTLILKRMESDNKEKEEKSKVALNALKANKFKLLCCECCSCEEKPFGLTVIKNPCCGYKICFRCSDALESKTIQGIANYICPYCNSVIWRKLNEIDGKNFSQKSSYERAYEKQSIIFKRHD